MSLNNELKTPEPPAGNLLLRTLAMPGDTNPAGDIFGGWIMSQMDIAGSLLAREIACGRVVTVAVDGMSFLKPVKVGNVVCCYGRCTRLGHSSITIELELWVKQIVSDGDGVNEHIERHMVTKAHYTYVKVNSQGRPVSLPQSAAKVASEGIDAGSIGLNADGTPRHRGACCLGSCPQPD